MSRLVVDCGERELRLDPVTLQPLLLLLEVMHGELGERLALARLGGGEPASQDADSLL